MKKEIAYEDLTQQQVLPFVPEKFSLSGTLFFTFGYDLGVVYGNRRLRLVESANQYNLTIIEDDYDHEFQ